MSNEMLERVGRAIDAVQIFSRFNDWTEDRVEGFPIEICRHSSEDVGDAIIIKRFPASKGEDNALREVVSEMRARAAIEEMLVPTDPMKRAAYDAPREVVKIGGGNASKMLNFEAQWIAAINAALYP